MSEAILDMCGVSKSYGADDVLRRLDLAVPAGSVTGLLGKNGAGKTTLLKCALGLIRPRNGSIALMGEPAWSLSAETKARIGYVPQVVYHQAWMKVRHVIAFTAAFYRTWNSELVANLVSDWELDLDLKAGNLSVGQAQKLAIIVALGHEPDLLVLDEPAASLDPSARREFLRTLLQIVSRGERTVLFSTHITSDLERVADRVAVLKDGQVSYQGDLDALKDEVKQIRVRTEAPLPDVLDLPGLLRSRIEGNSALLSVRGVTPDLLTRIEEEWSASIDVRDLNLEDIFLELHDD